MQKQHFRDWHPGYPSAQSHQSHHVRGTQRQDAKDDAHMGWGSWRHASWTIVRPTLPTLPTPRGPTCD